MKRILLPLVLLICCISSVNAGYINGNVLRSMSLAAVTENSHLQYVGYVVGVIDADEQKTICVDTPPNELSPVLDEVKNYLATNKDKLNEPGHYLIIQALLPKYACQSHSAN